MRLFTGLCLLGLAGCAANPSRPTSGEYRVSGELKSAGGVTLPAAQVQLFKMGETEPFTRADAAADGHFSLAAPGPGDYNLRFVSPGHPYRDVYLQILPDAREVSLEATLQPYVYLEKPTDPLVVGDWNDLDPRSAEHLEAQADGTWVLERAVPGERVSYLLRNITEDDRRSPMSMSSSDGATCPRAEHYTMDEQDLYYLCQAPVKEGRIRIVYDPRTLPRAASPSPMQVTFAPPYAFLNPLTALRVRARFQSVRAWQQKGFDYATLPEELLGFARDPGQPRLARQLAALDLLMLTDHPLAALYPGDKGEALARELFQLLPAESPVWGINHLFTQAITKPIQMLKPAQRHQLWYDFADRNPTRMVQSYALSALMQEALEGEDMARAAVLAGRLTPLKTPFASMALGSYRRVAQSLKGKPVPAFSAPLLDGPETVSRESMLGRFYLIDFWATWCKPCVQEIPSHAAALEKFKGRGNFTVLSVNFDPDLETVRTFRERTHKMPWLHIANGGDMGAPMPKAFDISSLPRGFLVDAAGRVVAVDGELRGEKLEKTLEKLLPPATP